MSALYCPTVVGQWQPENGVILRIDPYNDPTAALKEFLFRQHNIPVDVPVPHNVAALAQAGVDLAAYPGQAKPIWALARKLLAEARQANDRNRKMMAAE